MNKFLSVFLSAAFLLLGGFATAFAQTKTDAKQTVNNDLAALLPASDAVAVGDMKRLFADALPQLLSSNPQMLAEMNRVFDEFKTKTGLDARQFERVAIGVK